ncbi:MAG: leucine-rich repeat protein, partial [Sodaliphilus sp.]|nr:leucine-rich repeat protein [Sodaliphilus sp.]
NSVSTMGEGAFFYAAQLETTNLPDSLTTVPAFTFAGAEALVGESIVPATATEMGDFSFYNACAMANFAIPKSINRIGTKAMAGMTGLDTIKAHSDAVPALGDSVWAGIDQPSVKLDLTNMALAEDFAHAAQWEHFHILKNYLLGDVNGDGNLDVADATLLISYILGENPNPFHLELANIIDDGVIDVTDVSALINMILSGDQIIIRRTPVTPHTTLR